MRLRRGQCRDGKVAGGWVQWVRLVRCPREAEENGGLGWGNVGLVGVSAKLGDYGVGRTTVGKTNQVAHVELVGFVVHMGTDVLGRMWGLRTVYRMSVCGGSRD